jgi:hypothetical protein
MKVTNGHSMARVTVVQYLAANKPCAMYKLLQNTIQRFISKTGMAPQATPLLNYIR